MADRDITVFFNTHRLGALERALSEQDRSLEYELTDFLGKLYQQNVPEEEQEQVETLIAREKAEEDKARAANQRFALYHFHSEDDDFHFSSDLRSLYGAGLAYHTLVQNNGLDLSLDSMAVSYFGEQYQALDAVTFSVLCDAMPNDPRITAVMEFDFEDNMLTYKANGEEEWETVSLNDLYRAAHASQAKTIRYAETKLETFNRVLEEGMAAHDVVEETDSGMVQ